MKQISLRIPDELHDLALHAAEALGQSLNTFGTNALLSQVRARNYGEWREMVEASHKAAGFRGLSPEGRKQLNAMIGEM
jgi:uncharacterized protein (DUF1778 family)